MARVAGLISVNVGRPRQLAARRGRPLMSAIAKAPVDGRVRVEGVNVAGDDQADRRVHGGPDKAVYAYAAEDTAWWEAELGRPLGPGAFGENLTTSGWLETDVRIGDIWSWGEALLQVSQPRFPCFKLAMATGRNDVGKRMLAAGRNGWYLRVLQPGEVPAAGPITVVERGSEDATVLDGVRALLPGAPRELTERMIAVPPLAERWRAMLLDRLAVADE